MARHTNTMVEPPKAEMPKVEQLKVVQAPKVDVPKASARQGIYELVQDFYEALANHPDAKVLAADFNARPPQTEMFLDATREAQRIITLRFLMRWPHKERQ